MYGTYLEKTPEEESRRLVGHLIQKCVSICNMCKRRYSYYKVYQKECLVFVFEWWPLDFGKERCHTCAIDISK